MVLILPSGSEEIASAHTSIPQPDPALAAITAKFTEYDVVLRPDKDEAEWWAGAPSIVHDNGVFWLAARMRTPDATRGLRGYEIRILRSEDGIDFKPVHSIKREDLPIPGFERPALLKDPVTGKFKLYACGPFGDQPWNIIKFDDADSPDQFDPKTARTVIAPPAKTYERDQAVIEYKDPVIIYAQGAFHGYVIGYMRRNERIYHFTSSDGETWQPVGNPYNAVMDLSGWHDFFIRPSAVLPLGMGYLFVYEGSKTDWYDPVYNVCLGLGFTFDLHHITDLTPNGPLAVSTTPSEHFALLRYSVWLDMGREIWVYAEANAPNDTHEIRRYRLVK
jgi:hypothetical protein